MFKFIFLLSCTCMIFQVNTLFAANSNPTKLYSCTGKYALCSASMCKKNSDASATCECPIFHGNNLGDNKCEDRNNPEEGTVFSYYSPKFLTSNSSKLFDPGEICKGENFSYADCFGVICEVDKIHKKKAKCQCPILTNKVAIQIQSDSCEKSEELCQYLVPNSNHIVVNSAPLVFGDRVILQSLRDEGLHFNPSQMMCAPSDK